MDVLIALLTILLLCAFLGALGCLLAEAYRFVRWFRKDMRWQRTNGNYMARWRT